MSGWNGTIAPVGVWRGVGDLTPDLARSIEGLGYGAIWLGGSPASDLDATERLLDATESIPFATGIVNIWNSDAAELAHSYARVEERHPGRLLLGIGTGHREATPQRVRPLEAMNRYLDVLDEGGVPRERRVLSALGPKMLEIAHERSSGTHPYLTVPSQTAEARAALGAGALVVPEQTVVLDTDAETARASARGFLARYLGMVNYTSNMLRGGLAESDLTDGGSDRLVDAIVPHGDARDIAAAVSAHLDAGADQVCIQIVPVAGDITPALAAIARELQLD